MTVLPEVRRSIVATAARQAMAAEHDPPRVRRGHRPRGVLPIALSAAVAVAVAVIALVSLTHRAAPRGPAGAPHGGAAALEQRLAVLRRPQTAADRSYPFWLGPPRDPTGLTPIKGLTRLATTVTIGELGQARVDAVRVYLIVERLPVGVGAPRRRTGAYTVNAVAVTTRGVRATGSGPLTAAELATPSTVGSGGNTPGQPAGVTVGIVPDGVSHVRWEFSGAGFGVMHPRPVTVSPQVQNNVAVAPYLADEGPLVQATWYGLDGQVIQQSAANRTQRDQLRTITAVNASRNRPVAAVLRDHYGLFRSVPADTLARDSGLPTPGTSGGYVGQMRLNYWETRHVTNVTGLDGPGLWITPGSAGLCISDPQTSLCGKVSHRILDGFVGGITDQSRQETIAGLVPDGNPTITLVLADGSRRTVPVVDHNVYEATVPSRVVAVINRSASGVRIRHNLG